MAIPPRARAAQADAKQHQQVARAMDRARDQAAGAPAVRLDLTSARYVIFSDQHKGARNGADDFRRCERAYNAALAYYYEAGYHLVELGDVEELWEERPATVLKQYEHSTRLAARFHQAGRYSRVWGNHDDEWNSPASVRQYLGPIFGDGLAVREALRFAVEHQGRELGTLLLVHGHQGSTTSDRWGRVSRLPVRWVWRPLQRLFNISLNTPAKDWDLRERHNLAMYAWAARQPGQVLIAGHTHRPVFLSKTLSAQLQERLVKARALLVADPENAALQQVVAELSAELEWTRAQDRRETGQEGATPPPMLPCYFNTGCCSYLDGDITGLEITGGEIRLVRWPDDEDRPRGQVLERMSLAQVFEQLAPASTPVPARR